MISRVAKGAGALVRNALGTHQGWLWGLPRGVAAAALSSLPAAPVTRLAPREGAASIASTAACEDRPSPPVGLIQVDPGAAAIPSSGGEDKETLASLPQGPEKETRQASAGGKELPVDSASGSVSFKSSTDLGPADVNRNYSFDVSLVPEAFASYYKAEMPEDLGQVPLLAGGCKALQLEFENTDKTVLLARDIFLKLMSLLKAGKRRLLLLDGERGCGKSILLVGLVEWARKQKWLVMYVPSAFAMTTDPCFFQRPDEQCWDTPNCARDLLRSVLDAHGDELQELKQGLGTETGLPGAAGSGETLADLCRLGMNTTLQQPALTVDTAIRLLHEFLHVDHGVRKLVVVDDYNALFWLTTYVEWIDDYTRRAIEVQNLALAREFRLMDGTPADPNCQVVVAPTHSGGIRRAKWFPTKGVVVEVPPRIDSGDAVLGGSYSASPRKLYRN